MTPDNSYSSSNTARAAPAAAVGGHPYPSLPDKFQYNVTYDKSIYIITEWRGSPSFHMPNQQHNDSFITLIQSKVKLYSTRYAIVVYAVVVCLSVCLSFYMHVTSQQCTKMARHRIMQTMPYNSAGSLSFLPQKISAKFQRHYPLRGRQISM